MATSYQKLRRMLRQHIDQTIRTRNFKARNEIIVTGALVKSHKGRNISAERKVGEQLDSVHEETFAGSATGLTLVNGHNHLPPTRTDGRTLYKYGSVSMRFV